MAGIANLRLEGFQSIQHLDLEFGPLNVLIGANGSGKSNLIRFFLMLNYMLSPPSGALRRWVSENGYASTLLHYGPSRTRQMRASLTFESEAGRNEYAFELAHAVDDSLFFNYETVKFSRQGAPWETALAFNLGEGHAESMLLRAVDLPLNAQPTANVHRALMQRWRAFHFHDTSPTALIRLSHSTDDDAYLRHNAGNLAPFLLRMATDSPGYYKRIVGTIRLIAPYFGDFFLEPQNRQVLLRWIGNDSDYIFGAHQLSDGTLRFIALATLLLQPNPPGMIIIDEPELGLHPAALHILAELLESASTRSQVLVTTQSARFLDFFVPEEVIVANVENGASIFQKLSSDELQDWLEDYTLGELWEKNVIKGRPSK